MRIEMDLTSPEEARTQIGAAIGRMAEDVARWRDYVQDLCCRSTHFATVSGLVDKARELEGHQRIIAGLEDRVRRLADEGDAMVALGGAVRAAVASEITYRQATQLAAN